MLHLDIAQLLEASPGAVGFRVQSVDSVYRLYRA